MQISSVPFVAPSEVRDLSSISSSNNAELKSQNSTVAAVNEPSQSESSGRQTEQNTEPQTQAASDSSEQEESSSNGEAIEAQFTEQEIQQIKQLESRDREVRAHEQAHQAVGGQYAGAASYTYQRGPDGVNYAIGGEVPIDAGPVQGDPEATIEKADVVRRAALAPAEPSVQDRLVAAEAAQMKIEAQSELAAMEAEARQEALSEEDESDNEQTISSESNSEPVNENPQSVQGGVSETNTDPDEADQSEIEFVDASLSPNDLANLLASEVARRNAMAVFENINSEPPKINLDELV